MRKLTPATPEDRTRVKVAIAALIAARNELTAAGCTRAAAAAGDALRSARGAERHLNRRLSPIQGPIQGGERLAGPRRRARGPRRPQPRQGG